MKPNMGPSIKRILKYTSRFTFSIMEVLLCTLYMCPHRCVVFVGVHVCRSVRERETHRESAWVCVFPPVT